MSLETAYADGQLAALEKFAWPAPTDATVADSSVLREKQAPTSLPQAMQAGMAPPATPQTVTQIFDAHEQGKTRTEPKRKLSAELCTTCRKAKHYGSCGAPRAIPEKAADFNPGMLGSDPQQGDDPSTSPHYHAATTADSSLARARDGRPADEQAGSMFADLFRHQGITNNADEPGRMTGGLNKVALTLNQLLLGGGAALGGGIGALRARPGHRLRGALGGAVLGGAAGAATPTLADGVSKFLSPSNSTPSLASAITSSPDTWDLYGDRMGAGHAIPGFRRPTVKNSDWQLWGTGGHSTWERRGPGLTPNPYEERLTVKSPPVGWGDEGPQRIERAFDQIDGAADTTSIEDSSRGQPTGGPAV